MNENDLNKLFPNCSASTRRRNSSDHAPELPTRTVPQSVQREALVESGQRKGKSPRRHAERYRICFTVFSVRPRDWDNLAASCKQLQDVLVESGFLPDDNWKVLEGLVVSEKAKSVQDQKTVVTITRCL